MKKAALLFLVFSLSFVLYACNGESEPYDEEGRVVISFFGWGSAEEQANYQALVDKFMELNDDIAVTYSAVSADMYLRNLNNRMNNLPDVFYIPDTDFMQWADAGRLLELDDHVEQAELDAVWDMAIDHYRYNRDTFTLGEGSLYAFPKDLGPFAMVMNVDLFDTIVEAKALDIDRPDPDTPMTWDEYVELLLKLECNLDSSDDCVSSGGQKIFGVTHYELEAAIYSNNANFFNEDATEQTIDDQNFIDALQFIADLDLEHGVMPSASEQANLNGFQRFMNGGGIFSFMGPWDMRGFWQNVDFEFDLIPMPVGMAEGAQSTAWVGSMGIAVSADTRQQEAAVRLAKFLTMHEESQRMAYELGQAVPNIIDLAENDFLNNVGLEGRQTMPENKKVFLDIIRSNDPIYGKPRARYYTYDNIWFDDFAMDLLRVYNGNETAQEFLSNYADTLQDDLDSSNAYLD